MRLDLPKAATSTIIIGVAGPSGAGKSAIVELAMDLLGRDSTVISLDSYYRDLRHMPSYERVSVNFDQLEALDLELLISHVRTLRSGNSINVPIYDFVNHIRTDKSDKVAPFGVVFVEGRFVLAEHNLRIELDLNLFVDAPDRERLHRRIARDLVERGWTIDQINHDWREKVGPAEKNLIYPSRSFADLIIDNVGSPHDAAAMIVSAVIAYTAGVDH